MDQVSKFKKDHLPIGSEFFKDLKSTGKLNFIFKFSFLFLFFIQLSGLSLAQFSGTPPLVIDPNNPPSCPQNNVTIIDLQFLGPNHQPLDPNADYEPGEIIDGTIAAIFGGSSSNAYNLYIQYDIFIDGVFSTSVYDCKFSGENVNNDGVTPYDVIDFSLTVGQEIELKNIYLTWRSGNAGDGLCPASLGNAQCYWSAPGFLVRTPLVPNFSSETSCDDYTVNFFDATTGGNVGNYSWSWDFNGDGIEDSNVETPSYNFGAAGIYDVTLTVDDGVVNPKSITLPVEVFEIFQLEVNNKTNDGCSVEPTGSIDIDVSGGDGPYTFEWSTSDGSGLVTDAEDQSGLSAGTYSVTVSDSRGCILTQEIVIEQDICSLTIDKVADKATVSAAGEVITYTITVDNTGNVDLTNVVLTDVFAGGATLTSGDLNTNNILETTETWVYTADYTVTQTDMNAGSPLVNVAEVDTDQTDPASDDATTTITQTPVLSITKTAVVVDAAGDGVLNEAGEIIGYEIVIINTGNVSLTGVSVVDPLTGINETYASPIAPGTSVTIPTSYAITQADLDNNGGGDGDIDNTATADSDQTDPVTDSEEVPLDQDPSLAIDKTVLGVDDLNGNGLTDAGDRINYNINVANDGNVTLTNVTVSDPLLGGSLATGVTLAPGADADYQGSYVILQSDVDTNGGGDGDIDNTATADSDQTDPVTDSEEVPVVQDPSISIDKSASQQEYEEVGEVITYTFTVTNTGNVTLTNVTVDDPLAGLSAITPSSVATLAPGADAFFTATYEITQADLDNGIVFNEATASGFLGQVEYTDSDDETISAIQRPDISLEKSAAPKIYDTVGDEITYTFTVTNTGNVTLSNVTVNDPLSGLSAVSPASVATLAPGADAVFSATYEITQEDLDNGSVVNEATASGFFGNDEYTDTDTEIIDANQLPNIELIKNGTYEDTNNDQLQNEGDKVIYTFTVTNTGNVTLTGVTIDDPKVAVLGGPIASLAPQASDNSTFTAEYVLTQQDIDAGSFTNIATVNATAPDQSTVSDEDDHTEFFVPTPAIGINKTASPTVVNAAGQQVTYTLTVTNEGNVTLENVTITDPLTGFNENVGTLAPDAVVVRQTVYNVTQTDIDNGSIVNVATATGSFGEAQVSDEDDATVTATQRPAIQIVKEADPTTVNAAGQEVTYTLTVTNTGNVTLQNVTITDPLTGFNQNVGSVAPGQVVVRETAYEVTQADIDNGSIVNVATATGNFGDAQVSDEDDATVTVTQAPSIQIVKEADPTTVNAAGKEVTYTLTVTNTGNVTLTNVTITDPLTGFNENVGTL
ncbi:DUF7507 domain-containing protein, partial [Algoriphagus limi]|nr:hypothetical protein [Algoriphagus limi]